MMRNGASLATRAVLPACALLLCSAMSAAAQAPPTATDWSNIVPGEFTVTPSVTYLTENNFEMKVDIYAPRGITTPNPTVILIHGGGWVNGSKEVAVLNALPYMEMGWSVVNVQYRLARVSLAPAAVEDCRCALRWVIRNAEQYKFDVNKIVITGHSAGGHLSLITGMLNTAAGLDRQCPPPVSNPPDPAKTEVKVAAIVNWYGITDVGDLFEGPNQKNYAVTWMGSQLNRDEIAKRVSPLTYVRAGLPPIITIHGDDDPTVPYAHATHLKAALDKAGVTNQLVTIPGGKHGGFTREEYRTAWEAIRAFLAKQGLTPIRR